MKVLVIDYSQRWIENAKRLFAEGGMEHPDYPTMDVEVLGYLVEDPERHVGPELPANLHELCAWADLVICEKDIGVLSSRLLCAIRYEFPSLMLVRWTRGNTVTHSDALSKIGVLCVKKPSYELDFKVFVPTLNVVLKDRWSFAESAGKDWLSHLEYARRLLPEA